jgi:hypothetical protein
MKMSGMDVETIEERNPGDVQGDSGSSSKHNMEMRQNRTSSHKLSAKPFEQKWSCLVSHKGYGATLQITGKTEKRVLRCTQTVRKKTYNKNTGPLK